MTDPLVHSSNQIIEGQLSERIMELETVLDADVITYIGRIDDLAHSVIKDVLDSCPPKRKRLALFLETPGGFIESTERIVNTLRHHYETVDFVVTNFAMSAGTVLAMSGDAIYMDYSAVLGPIDPQVQKADSGLLLPALGYLEQYARLIKKSAAGTLTTAELTYLIQRFDPGELYRYEQARDLSIALLEEWLVKYKFKNWVETETQKKRVTEKMRSDRARRIAKQLNDTEHWHSHSRGISMEVLQRDLKLLIEDIDRDPKLRKATDDYTELLYDYRARRGHRLFVTNWREGYHGHGHEHED
jgi:hypothetical protein